jgi:hypothetical protein
MLVAHRSWLCKWGKAMGRGLSDYCVSTIVRGDLLKEAARKGRPVTFTEGKPWVTGRDLWQAARAARLGMPVLLSDARHCSRLLYWGLLTSIELGGGSTSYRVDKVRRLKGKHTRQELILRSTGRQVAANFIRPYAIVETPEFLTGAT